MKTIKQLLLILAMLIPMMASAETVEIDGIYYNLSMKTFTAEVISNPNKYSGEVTIPKTVKSGGYVYNVASIGDNAFELCRELTSVSFPNCVKSIGASAFANCSALPSLIIPNSVTTIGNNAFHGCESLSTITIPNSVTSIGSNVFLAVQA